MFKGRKINQQVTGHVYHRNTELEATAARLLEIGWTSELCWKLREQDLVTRKIHKKITPTPQKIVWLSGTHREGWGWQPGCCV